MKNKFFALGLAVVATLPLAGCNYREQHKADMPSLLKMEAALKEQCGPVSAQQFRERVINDEVAHARRGREVRDEIADGCKD